MSQGKMAALAAPLLWLHPRVNPNWDVKQRQAARQAAAGAEGLEPPHDGRTSSRGRFLRVCGRVSEQLLLLCVQKPTAPTSERIRGL